MYTRWLFCVLLTAFGVVPTLASTDKHPHSHFHPHTLGNATPEYRELSPSTEAVELWYFQTHARQLFRAEAIHLALSYTASMKPRLQLRPWPQELTQQRAVSILRSGKYPMFGTLSDHSLFNIPELERTDRSLLAGLLGFRLLLVREEQLQRLARVDSKESLVKAFRMGFGRHWRDYSILEANNFQLTGTAHYSSLFPMLEAGRFDAIPRGIGEVFDEEALWGPDIRVSESVALYYPYPVYIYMHEDFAWVLKRIDYGLMRAEEDGRLESLFKRHFKSELHWIKTREPKVFVLKNPFQSNSAPSSQLCWWASSALLEHLTEGRLNSCAEDQ